MTPHNRNSSGFWIMGHDNLVDHEVGLMDHNYREHAVA